MTRRSHDQIPASHWSTPPAPPDHLGGGGGGGEKNFHVTCSLGLYHKAELTTEQERAIEINSKRSRDLTERHEPINPNRL